MKKTSQPREDLRWRAAFLACSMMLGVLNAAGQDLPDRIDIPGKRVFPESLTSTSDGRLLIGSIGYQGVFRVSAGASAATLWVSADRPSNRGVLGVFADERARILWACWSAVPGFTGPKLRSSLNAYDLATGRFLASYPLPRPQALCNDIATDAHGAVYVTDSNNMEVDRLGPERKALRAWAKGAQWRRGDILDGIAVLGERMYVNALVPGKLFLIRLKPDGSAGTPQEVQLDRPIMEPDGMRAFGNSSVLVVESKAPGRLSIIELADAQGHVKFVHEGYPGGPVSVALVKETAYVLEGQLEALLEPSKHSAPVTPFTASAAHVGKPIEVSTTTQPAAGGALATH